MEHTKSVLIVGLDPTLIDFSHPDFAPFNLSAEKVLSAVRADSERLSSLGYQPETCLTDFGQTAEAVVADKLRAKPYACVMIGAGVRLPPSNFLLFERLVNVVIAHAPQSKLCFNTRPNDTAEAVMRWI